MADFKSREFDNGLTGPASNGISSGNGVRGGAMGHGTGDGGGYGAAHGGAHGAAHGGAQPPHPEHGLDSFLQILARQWHVMLLTLIASCMAGVLYLMVAHKVYTAQARLRVTPMDPAAIASATGSASAQDDSDFLATECLVIKSNAVLALAMDKIREAPTLQPVPRLMDYVKAVLQAKPSTEGKAIEVTFESTSRDDATLVVAAVIDAYKEYESNSWQEHAKKIISMFHSGSEEQRSEMQDKEQKLTELAKRIGFAPDMDPERSPQHEEVVSLREELRKAEAEKRAADAADAQAGKAILGHPDLVQKFNDSLQQGMYSTSPKDQLEKYQQELAIEEAKLLDDSRHYGPANPVIITDQGRVNDMIVAKAVAAHGWVVMTTEQRDAISSALEKAQKSELDLVSSQREYERLQKDIARLQQNGDEIDNRIKTTEVTKRAGALNIDVLDPAELSPKVKPEKARTLMISFVLGIMGGLALACVRDWTDDRMRTPQAVRTAVGASVLGSIPVIATAYTAADRGQIVHHDPFGDAAESFRTLRTALQFGLPAGTKTLLVTSPVSGDGKSTFVSNLGIAMAQSSMRILIIDADLRAPMQHRLFGLQDLKGLSTVLGGTDTLEQAIQRTEIERLDVLPCGPAPFNPAEMLNSPAFAEKLEELADRYDLVLLDSPPITAVADARILAACADVSLLVLRTESSTRKNAEAARDGLRSVGARLIGVAVNGVARNSHFTSATGYYPHRDPPVIARNRKTERSPDIAAHG
jgi:capsular exopolysaccharide synthesis family protein